MRRARGERHRPRRRRRCVRERRAGWLLRTSAVGIATTPSSRLVAGCFSFRFLFRAPVACDDVLHSWKMQPI
uniref:Uncharacterized protein n=1 Tax=Oryza meridionalis TaxID=40149 RepID=A0A0E0EED2_9ORYZ